MAVAASLSQPEAVPGVGRGGGANRKFDEKVGGRGGGERRRAQRSVSIDSCGSGSFEGLSEKKRKKQHSNLTTVSVSTFFDLPLMEIY